jgi:hypothetical protein
VKRAVDDVREKVEALQAAFNGNSEVGLTVFQFCLVSERWLFFCTGVVMHPLDLFCDCVQVAFLYTGRLEHKLCFTQKTYKILKSSNDGLR